MLGQVTVMTNSALEVFLLVCNHHQQGWGQGQRSFPVGHWPLWGQDGACMQQEGQGLVEAIILVAAWPFPCFPFPPLPTVVQEVAIRPQKYRRPHHLLRIQAVGCGLQPH